MKSKIVSKLLTLSAAVFTFFAMTISASACTFGCYQPEEPKCLRDE